MKIFKYIIILGIFLLASVSQAVDVAQVEKELTTTGCVGWVHGSVQERGLFVFTYRNPNNFFDYLIMSLVPSDPSIATKLAALSRHDKVLVKGSFLPNPSPQKHIKVTSIEPVTSYQSGYPSENYQYEAKIPGDLLNINSAVFLVHAIAGEGKILVLEYKDAVIPMFVKNGELTKNLYRNDLVELSFKIQLAPDHPSHLNLDEDAPAPIKVLEAISSLHGKEAHVEGALVMFPKSPEIKFNVFAVQQLLPAGLNRQFTLVNFENPEVFTQMREALQKAWDRHAGEYFNNRNKLVSKKIRVKVSGTFNEVDANQANPQVLLKSINDLQIIE
jgi:hypothetical protein